MWEKITAMHIITSVAMATTDFTITNSRVCPISTGYLGVSE